MSHILGYQQGCFHSSLMSKRTFTLNVGRTIPLPGNTDLMEKWEKVSWSLACPFPYFLVSTTFLSHHNRSWTVGQKWALHPLICFWSGIWPKIDWFLFIKLVKQWVVNGPINNAHISQIRRHHLGSKACT